jgi:hypothetical protein
MFQYFQNKENIPIHLYVSLHIDRHVFLLEFKLFSTKFDR